MAFGSEHRRYRWIETARRMTSKPLPALPREVEHWGEAEQTDLHRFVALAVLGAIGVVADLAGLLAHGFALELAIFGFAVCALFAYRWRSARWRRQIALDDLILGAWSGAVPEPDEAEPRRRMLLRREQRHALARDLRRLVHACCRRPYEASRTIANGLAVRRHRKELERIADLLDGPRPVRCEGVILLSRLLMDGRGPLYTLDPGDDELGEALTFVEHSLAEAGAGASA